MPSSGFALTSTRPFSLATTSTSCARIVGVATVSTNADVSANRLLSAITLFPPGEMLAPRAKSGAPPTPETSRDPISSELTLAYRSAFCRSVRRRALLFVGGLRSGIRLLGQGLL